jgi:hypothetical protein
MSWTNSIRAIRGAAEDAFRWTMQKLGWNAADFDEMTNVVEAAVAAYAKKQGVPPAVVDQVLTSMFSHLDAYAAGLIANQAAAAQPPAR